MRELRALTTDSAGSTFAPVRAAVRGEHAGFVLGGEADGGANSRFYRESGETLMTCVAGQSLGIRPGLNEEAGGLGHRFANQEV